jgi:hypothetical protein
VCVPQSVRADAPGGAINAPAIAAAASGVTTARHQRLLFDAVVGGRSMTASSVAGLVPSMPKPN